LDASNGDLLVRTGVTGRAASLGHRLTIAMASWQAAVGCVGAEPASVELVVDVRSLEVLRGEGGVKGLSGPEKMLVRSNALNCLGANRFPQIRFHTADITKSGDGYRLAGALEIHGKTREHVIEVRIEDLGDSWRMSTETVVRQTEFGVKPYSMFMGAMKVADEVTVSFDARRAKDH
jgi:polyisoprenoid-binding protein YceI